MLMANVSQIRSVQPGVKITSSVVHDGDDNCGRVGKDNVWGLYDEWDGLWLDDIIM